MRHGELERSAADEGQELLGRAHRVDQVEPGPVTQPIFQPVNEKVLPALEIGDSALGHPRQLGDRDVWLVEGEVLVHLVGDDEQVVLDRRRRATASSSSRLSTAPVGLCGEFSRIDLGARSVTASRSRSSSSRKSGGSSRTGTQRPRAIAMVARYES